MAILDLDQLAATLRPGQRLIGLDPGSKTIGIAVSDVMRMVATPRETVRRGKFALDAAKIADLIEAENVGGVVIGLPLSMDGSEGPRCQSVRQFAENLAEWVAVPMAFWDERLSTAAVERAMVRESDLSRKKRARAVDKAAAAYILQGALDALAHRSAAL